MSTPRVVPVELQPWLESDIERGVARYLRMLLSKSLSLRELNQGELWLEVARERIARRASVPKRPRVGVVAWELAHNPAGRALTLAEAHEKSGALVEILGPLLPAWSGRLWPPMLGTRFTVRHFEAQDLQDLFAKAVDLVISNPYDVVHLSKPRIPTLIFGILYSLIWNSKVIWDVDDEELGFVNAVSPMQLSMLTNQMLSNSQMHGQDLTRFAVGQVGRFDEVTVSNPALQARYGGKLLPHVRDETTFSPSRALRRQARRWAAIPDSAVVVLFAGTPRRHKGILETAWTLSRLSHSDVYFVIVGDFPDPTLEHELMAVEGVRIVVIPGRSYDHAAFVAAIGDCTVLLQDPDSLVATHQLPAKLVDALAVGQSVLVQRTPATEWLIDLHAVTAVTRESLEVTLEQVFASARDPARRLRNRAAFLDTLSTGSYRRTIEDLQQAPKTTVSSWEGKLRALVELDLVGLLS